MSKIFICYRREDSADVAGRIFDHLARRFGRDRLFMDIDAIPYGEDFRRRIERALDDTQILLALIGDHWAQAKHPAGLSGRARLHNPDDYVRLEIAAALERGIKVVPVLVGQGEMPRREELPPSLAELSFRNAAEVRSGRDFAFHVGRLADAIAEVLHGPRSGEPPLLSAGNTSPLPISFTLLQEHPAKLVGLSLGPFMIQRLLAVGGSGLAYLARNPRTGQQVCVKVSLPILSDMENIRRALSRGIRGLVALNHPHIVRIHEFATFELQDGRSFYVVMDHVEGLSLDRWASALQPNREGLGSFLQLAVAIARALDAAHNCRYVDEAGFETVGVMHGDVKPGNVLVRPDGTPAVLDFMMVDIQRALDPDAKANFETQDNVTLAFGTPGFMAPEQEKEGIVTVRTDVYGLGATLFSCWGELPLPSGVIALLGRMTGPLEGRPHDMNEVARLLAEAAHSQGMQVDDLKALSRSAQDGVRRGIASRIASWFWR